MLAVNSLNGVAFSHNDVLQWDHPVQMENVANCRRLGVSPSVTLATSIVKNGPSNLTYWLHIHTDRLPISPREALRLQNIYVYKNIHFDALQRHEQSHHAKLASFGHKLIHDRGNQLLFSSMLHCNAFIITDTKKIPTSVETL